MLLPSYLQPLSRIRSGVPWPGVPAPRPALTLRAFHVWDQTDFDSFHEGLESFLYAEDSGPAGAADVKTGQPGLWSASAYQAPSDSQV
jgi:hypothetical protein